MSKIISGKPLEICALIKKKYVNLVRTKLTRSKNMFEEDCRAYCMTGLSFDGPELPSPLA